ncbi:hypothetical protein TcWFU_001801 [Taenia crassiceps]|uniref:Uncharacterized protein n=1 Tax=Taenia crassiceps TaxID=6207 RepID=A0ABR4QCY6_9CEST
MGGKEGAELDPVEGCVKTLPEEGTDNLEAGHDCLESKGTEKKGSSCQLSDPYIRGFLDSMWNAPILEPYPCGSDGEMIFENLRTMLKAPPRSIIDYMGYVPNSVIRKVIGVWLAEYAEMLIRRKAEVYAKSEGLKLKAKEYHAIEEEAARVEKENKRKMQRKKSRRYTATISLDDRLKTPAAEDMWLLDGTAVEEFIMGEEEHTASKEDVQRLKKIRHEATQEVFDQSALHKGKFLCCLLL